MPNVACLSRVSLTLAVVRRFSVVQRQEGLSHVVGTDNPKSVPENRAGLLFALATCLSQVGGVSVPCCPHLGTQHLEARWGKERWRHPGSPMLSCVSDPYRLSNPLARAGHVARETFNMGVGTEPGGPRQSLTR